jgi:hypothetical protein
LQSAQLSTPWLLQNFDRIVAAHLLEPIVKYPASQMQAGPPKLKILIFEEYATPQLG